MSVSKDLMGILACPKCKGELEERGMFLICSRCKLAYPVLDGVPDMLIEDAWSFKRAKTNKFKHNLKL